MFFSPRILMFIKFLNGTRMEALVAIVLVDGWGQVRGRPPKTCALYFAILGFLHISWRLYCSNHLFYDWPLGDCTSVFNTSSRQRVIEDDIFS